MAGSKKAKASEGEGRGAGTLLLIDVSGFVFRAFHALPPLTTSRGQPTGAVYGFTNMLLKLLEDEQPEYVAGVFDTGPPEARLALLPAYKAQRPETPEELKSQLPYVERVVEAMNIAVVRKEGVEADDIIATLTKRAVAAGLRVLIVTSDKDLMQLVSDRVTILDTMRNKRYGPKEVEERYGVPPDKLGDWLAMVGDASDNVPGIPGVGPKTATRLLQQFPDLEAVLAGVDQVRGKKLKENLVTYADQARLARRLVELDTDVDIDVSIDDLRRREPDRKALWDLFGELEFGNLRQRVAPGSVLDLDAYRTILDEAALEEVAAAAREAGELAIDLETDSLDAVRAHVVGISLCWGEAKACYIPVAHTYLGAPPQLPLARVMAAVGPLLTDDAVAKYGQNHKYDWLVLRHRTGVDMTGVRCDPMLASYLLDPSRGGHGLDHLALHLLGHRMIPFAEVAGKEGRFDLVPLDQATRYAGEDAEATYRLARLLLARLEEQPDLLALLRDVEIPLSRVLAHMELRGCLVDAGALRALSREVAGELERIEQDIWRQAGWKVNVNSPKQLRKLLFEQLGLTTGRKTKTGYSTDADVLADLAVEHPIAAEIERFRTLSKLKSTYLDTLPELINPETGRLHTSYNQAVAATGRLSSSDPNLQNIPVRTELGRRIRAAFVAPEGRLLLSADYSQIELRILAHLSGDPVLVDAFRRGQDVHRRTAAEVFGVPPEEVTPEQRQVAKAVNFGVIYGQGEWGLARQLRISRGQARAYIRGYFERHAGVKAFMERVVAEAKKTGEVRTILGRRRPLPDINARHHATRAYAERVARNTPLQGSAADIMKMAMIRVEGALAEAGLDAPMILTVHDELVFEVLPQEATRVGETVRDVMVSVVELTVPLTVHIGVGPNWAEAH